MALNLTGTCTCKKLKYAVKLESADQGRTTLCHCSSCKKAFGTNYGLTSKIPIESFKYSKGEPKLFKQDNGVIREFCDNCGSFICEYGEAAADKFRYITYGSLDDPEKLPPKGEFFCETRSSWMPQIPGTSREKAPQPRPGNPPPYPGPSGSPRLCILGATWGGVQVTADIQAMVSSPSSDPYELSLLTLDMRTLHRVLQPDPAPGTVKTLSVLYTEGRGHDEGQDGTGTGTGTGPGPAVHTRYRLLNVSEQQTSPVTIRAAPAKTLAGVVPSGTYLARKLRPPFQRRRGRGRGIWAVLGDDEDCCDKGNNDDDDDVAGGKVVEILAVLYGPREIEALGVLETLCNFFEGERGQIRMTNSFFKADTWPDHHKSWTVYFRFEGSGRVQVVTGMENGALEVPWSRD